MKIELPQIITISIIIGIIIGLCIINTILNFSGFYDKQTYIYEWFKNLDLQCNK